MGAALTTIFRLFKSAPLLSEVDGGRANNINLIRFLLATAVVFSHCYVLFGRIEDEPMGILFPKKELGGTAVAGFFFLSGYLIFRSALRTPPEQFVVARVLRLFPALAVVTVACIFLLGPAVTTLSWHEYFSNAATMRYLGTMVLQLGNMQLPGVFEGGTVNQPLWTLGSEWLMYSMMLLVSIAVTARVGRLTRRGIIFTALALLFSLTVMSVTPWGYFFKWMTFSAFGVAAYIIRRWIPLSIPLMVFLIPTEILIYWKFFSIGKILFIPFLCYLLLVIGFHPKLHVQWQHKFGDYSYGIYILGWPFQQMFKTAAGTPVMLFASAFPLALAAAIISWHFIESPSLRRKRRGKRSQPPETELQGASA